MIKVLVLFFTLFLALASLCGYLMLTEKISSGEQQIAAGEKQLQEGQKMLDQGKAKLANAKREMSQAKTMSKFSTIGLTILSLPLGGVAYRASANETSEGDRLIAQGSVKVKVGEGRVEAGKLTLNQGKERLKLANKIRIACVWGSLFFASLTLVLGLSWRQALASTFLKRRSKK